MEWLGKNRRRVAMAVTAGAAGAAAYYAYRSWYGLDDPAALGGGGARGAGEEADREGEGQGDSEEDAAAAEEAFVLSAKRHFDSIQRITYATTLPSLLPQVKGRLAELMNLEALTERLQQARGAGANTLTPEQKLEMWNELKVLSAARAAAAAWGMCLLDMLLRTQLNLLGRHLYLAAGAGAGGARARGGGGVLVVSEGCQRGFMAHAEHLPFHGLAAVADAAIEAARAAVGGWDLKQIVSPGAARGILEEVAGGLGARAAARPGGWAGLLLPPDAPSEAVGGALPPGERDVLASLTAEARRVLASPQFAAACQAMSTTCVAAAADGLEATMLQAGPRAGLPLARLVPLMAGVSDGMLDAPGAVLGAMASNPAVETFCASVYSYRAE